MSRDTLPCKICNEVYFVEYLDENLVCPECRKKLEEGVYKCSGNLELTPSFYDNQEHPLNNLNLLEE